MMSRIIRVIIKNSSYQNINREKVNNREIRFLPDLFIFNLLSVFVLIQRILNYHPNYPTHRLYFGEVETPYSRLLGVDCKCNVMDHLFSHAMKSKHLICNITLT